MIAAREADVFWRDPTVYEVTRTTDGLIFRDQFNRADGSVGNGWQTVGSGTLSIDANRLKHVGNEVDSYLLRDDLTLPDGAILQVNANANNADGAEVGPVVRTDRLDGGSWRRYIGEGRTTGTNSWLMEHTINGGAGVDWQETSTTGAPPDTGWFASRLVTEKSGTDVLFRHYGITGLASGSDLSLDLALKNPHTDAAADGPGSPYDQFGVRMRDETVFADEFFICGRDIEVGGLPTGWKVQVDSRAAVAESGGSVTLNVDSWALHATTLTVLDSTDTVRATITPDDGIWGGDVYTVALSGLTKIAKLLDLAVDDSRAMLSALSHDSSGFDERQPSVASWRATANYLYAQDEASQKGLFSALIAGTSLVLRFQPSASSSAYYEGEGYMSVWGKVAAGPEAQRVNVRFLGDGPLQQVTT